MKYGLGEKVIEDICGVFAKFPAVEKVVLYGSRAQDTYREGSDIDLTFFGKDLTQDMLGDIAEALDDLLTPYTFDLSIFDDLEHAKLKDHIERVGVTFYERHSEDAVVYETVNLGDICELQNGFAFKSKLFKQVGIPVLRISSIQDEQVCDHRPVFVDPADYKEDLSKYIVKDGDLLIAMSGATTGKVGFNRTGTDFLLNQRVGKFKPSSRLDNLYLFYFLSTKVEENLAISAGSAQPNLSTSQIKGFQIPIPPLEEQKRIVAILDEAFAGIDQAIANTEKNLTNAKELFESYLNNIFTQKGDGWKNIELGEICYKITDGSHNPPKGVEHSNYMMLSSKNVFDDHIHFDKPRFLSHEAFEQENKRTDVSAGDVLLTIVGTIGRVAVYPYNAPKITLQRSVAVLKPKEGIVNSRYMMYALNACLYMLLGKARGVAQKGLYLKTLRQQTIPLPSIEEQKRVVEILDDLSNNKKRLEGIYKQKLSALQELKQSLLQKAFAGELTSDMREVTQ